MMRYVHIIEWEAKFCEALVTEHMKGAITERGAKITDKDYRLWFKINEDTSIGVKTSVGNSEKKLVKNSKGQGIFEAAQASSLNIGWAVKNTFRSKALATMGSMRLNCVVKQDNIAKIKDNLNEAREGCNKKDNTLKRKQKYVHTPSFMKVQERGPGDTE